MQESRGYSRIPDVLRNDGGVLARPQDIVNTFAEHSSSIYDAPDDEQEIVDIHENDSIFIGIGRITETDVMRTSRKLTNKRTTGLDEVQRFLVKDCICVLPVPLAHIFNLSASSGTYPSVGKRSKIIPVFKKNNRSIIANYHPISILSNFSHFFLIILHNSMFPALKNKIIPNQHGFMSQRSTNSNLVCFFEHVLQSLDSSDQIDVIYTDFQKAFDKVDNGILVNK